MSLPEPRFTWPSRNATAEEVLRWGFSEFGNRLAICTSFQATGSVMIDMAARLVGSGFNVFSIDTGRPPRGNLPAHRGIPAAGTASPFSW